MKKRSNLKMFLIICSLIVCFSFLISSHAQAQLPMSAFSPVMYFTPPAPGTTPTAATGLPSTFMPTVPTYGGLGTPWGAFGFLKPTMPTYGGLGAMAALGYGGWLGTPPTTTGLTGWFGKATISPATAPVPGLMTPGLMLPGLMPFPVAPTSTSTLPTTPFGLMAAMPFLGAGFMPIVPFVPPLPAALLTPTAVAAPLVAPTLAAPILPPTVVVPPPVLPTVAAPVLLPTVAAPVLLPTAVVPPPVIPTIIAPTAL